MNPILRFLIAVAVMFATLTIVFWIMLGSAFHFNSKFILACLAGSTLGAIIERSLTAYFMKRRG